MFSSMSAAPRGYRKFRGSDLHATHVQHFVAPLSIARQLCTGEQRWVLQQSANGGSSSAAATAVRSSGIHIVDSRLSAPSVVTFLPSWHPNLCVGLARRLLQRRVGKASETPENVIPVIQTSGALDMSLGQVLLLWKVLLLGASFCVVVPATLAQADGRGARTTSQDRSRPPPRHNAYESRNESWYATPVAGRPALAKKYHIFVGTLSANNSERFVARIPATAAQSSAAALGQGYPTAPPHHDANLIRAREYGTLPARDSLDEECGVGRK
jgi:hypothetical protein